MRIHTRFLCCLSAVVAIMPVAAHAGVSTTPTEAASASTPFSIGSGTHAPPALWQAPKTFNVALGNPTTPAMLCAPNTASTPKPHPNLTHRMEAERRRHWPTVVEAACSHGIPVALLDALIIQESRYNQAAISPAGAAGLTQLMPQTAVSVGVRNRFSAQESIWGGSRYLKSLLDRFGRMETALAAYNIGPTAVIQNGRPEKNAFVSKVLQHVEHSGVLPLKAVILKLPMPILDDGFVAPAMHTSLIQTQE